MTATQRVDVERFKAEVEPETEWSRAYVDMEPCKDGEWVRYSDYAALLQKIDQLHDDLSTARQSLYECAGQRNDALSSLADAERAREEAVGLLRRVNASLYLLDKPHREFGGVTDKTATDIAAFLAANVPAHSAGGE